MNTLYTNDNLLIMQDMKTESVDLIYLDPPFNTKKVQASKISGMKFKDIWKWEDVDVIKLESLIKYHPVLMDYFRIVKVIYDDSMMAYLAYMTQRLIEMYRILKDTGGLYFHCDQVASHYIKIVLDAIFGIKNFRNEIVWEYKSGGASKKHFSRKHDVILFYSKTKNCIFNVEKEKSYTKNKKRKLGITNYGVQNVEFFRDSVGVYNWVNPKDVWRMSYLNSNSAERTGYPTQKPLSLLYRIIKASSNEGDTILDPFCGSGTTLLAAQQLNRKWIGIDMNNEAALIVKKRLADDGIFAEYVHRKAI